MVWKRILGVKSNDTLETTKKKYHKLALTTHPNKGGTTAGMQQLQGAWELAQKHFQRFPTAGAAPRGVKRRPRPQPQRASGAGRTSARNTSSRQTNKESHTKTPYTWPPETTHVASQFKSYGEGALFDVSGRGDVDDVRLLLAMGVNVNATDIHGSTALFPASLNGHIDVVRVLLAAGAKVNATNRSGQTALYCAAGGGHFDVVSVLEAAGAKWP